MFNNLHDHDNVKLLTRGSQILNLGRVAWTRVSQRASLALLIFSEFAMPFKDILSFVDS
jgi:hypothetical protein